MKKRSLTLTSTMLLALGAATAQATTLELNLGEDAAQFEAAGNLTSNVELGGGFLSSDDRDADVLAGHVQLMGVERTRDYDIGVGVRWTQYDTDYGDGGGLGLGGYGYFYLPAVPRLSLGGYAFYTSGAVTNQDLDDSLEAGVRARYEVIRNIEAYVGYRHLKVDFDNRHGRTTLDDGPLVGVRLLF